MAVRDQTDEAFVNNPHTQRFTVLDDDASGSPKPPLDITGLVLKWGMVPIDSSDNFATTPLTLDKSTTGGGVVIVDGPNGIADVNITPSDTVNLNPIDYYFEFEVFDIGGANGVVVATGTLTLIPNLVNA